MKTFRQFIAESNKDVVSIIEKVNQLADSKMQGKQYNILKERAATFQLGYDNKEVYNTDLKDFNHSITRFLEQVYDYLVYTIYVDEFKASDFKDTPDSLFAIRSANKMLKHYQSFGSKYSKIVDFLEYVVVIGDMIKEAKSYIVKGKKPKAQDPNKPQPYMKPMASRDAIKQVSDILNKVVKDVERDYLKSMTKYYEDLVKALEQRNFSSPMEVLKIKDVELKLFAQKVFNLQKHNFGIKDDVDNIVKEQAERIVNDIIEGFVAKNTQKLSNIFEKKSGLKQHRIIENRIRNNVLENKMFFEFEDGSKFTIYSKVQYAYSKNGKLFIRVPTRFSDVYFADGSKMKMPSEEKMDKEF